ncbi:hypothetical protein DPMN_014614 [Dreissena polymorpha]|uniref:Uncharacterized protein n=1 Tax=Dreissena polymorpha TaxID=45954 RepID=A0A9D4NA05_DREPO|nr:hypothetical protein DPMN_014614 [Dreissena polymorpha]
MTYHYCIVSLLLQAGIATENLSLALEPEAAALYCRYLPMEKVVDSAGKASIESFAPGKRYLVLDAGGLYMFFAKSITVKHKTNRTIVN